jgi:lipopolysaccharide transport system ATP-binding protein
MKKVAEEEGRTILYVSHNMATVKSLCSRCVVLSHGQVAFEGETDEAIAVYMQNDDFDTNVFFDASNQERPKKCNSRHTITSVHFFESKTNTFEYGEKIPFRLAWNSTNDSERIKVKFFVYSMDSTPVGLSFGGSVNQIIGNNSVDYFFDTKFLVPGKYSVDILLYDEDQSGGVMYYDRCTSFRFSVEHNQNSIHLKNWFKDWGNAVLPCIEQIGGDDKNV